MYDARTGALIRSSLATGGGGTFVNDVVVTEARRVLHRLDRRVLYRVALTGNGAPASSATVLTLTGDFQLGAGFNLNGIDATPDGRTLFVVQSGLGKLFTVVAATGATQRRSGRSRR